jgi:hypothetical protein
VDSILSEGFQPLQQLFTRVEVTNTVKLRQKIDYSCDFLQYKPGDNLEKKKIIFFALSETTNAK